MKKNMKKYSVFEVMNISCEKKLVWKNWPFNKFKRLTVTDMVVIGVERHLDFHDIHHIIGNFDHESCSRDVVSTEKCVLNYIAKD